MRLYAPLVINIIWIIFFLFSIYELALINPVISMFFSALIIIIAWNNVKDFVQGTIFKLQQGNIIGQRIKVDAYSGVVIKMRNATIDLQLENGQIHQSAINNKFWVLAKNPIDTYFRMLEGEQHYQWIKYFDSHEEYQRERKSLYKYDTWSIYDPKESAIFKK